MRRLLLAATALAALAIAPASAPGHGFTGGGDEEPPDPIGNRAAAWTPKPAGTTQTIKLQYGPYVVHPGSDLSRVDVEVVPADGFVIRAKPSVKLADGSEPSHQDMHVHHAHWVKANPEKGENGSWFFGTGEEETEGGGEGYMSKDPRFESEGLRYGIPLHKGDKLAFVSMLHNKTSQPMTVWLEGEMTVVFGARDEIRQVDGRDFRPLRPVLHGSTFQVPRDGDGEYVHPRDLPEGQGGDGVRPGVGHVWTSPFDGTIVIGAGHLHPGGREVVVSNLGRPDAPCGNDDGDAYAGVTVLRIPAFYRDGVFPSEEFQMGITQPGWRLEVRRGDRLAINGVYDTTDYAYPDAMSFFGFYADTESPPGDAYDCESEFLGETEAGHPADHEQAIPNREWGPEEDKLPACDPALGAPNPCDVHRPLPAPGPRTDVVHIAGFQYLPGGQGLEGPAAGPPVVTQGKRIRFVNEDWAAGFVRHSATSCKTPCNGAYFTNYPFHDGAFESGVLGATALDTYQDVRPEPTGEIDTSALEPGYHTYYCRLHPSMRGGFYVEEAK